MISESRPDGEAAQQGEHEAGQQPADHDQHGEVDGDDPSNRMSGRYSSMTRR